MVSKESSLSSIHSFAQWAFYSRVVHRKPVSGTRFRNSISGCDMSWDSRLSMERPTTWQGWRRGKFSRPTNGHRLHVPQAASPASPRSLAAIVTDGWRVPADWDGRLEGKIAEESFVASLRRYGRCRPEVQHISRCCRCCCRWLPADADVARWIHTPLTSYSVKHFASRNNQHCWRIEHCNSR